MPLRRMTTDPLRHRRRCTTRAVPRDHSKMALPTRIPTRPERLPHQISERLRRHTLGWRTPGLPPLANKSTPMRASMVHRQPLRTHHKASATIREAPGLRLRTWARRPRTAPLRRHRHMTSCRPDRDGRKIALCPTVVRRIVIWLIEVRRMPRLVSKLPTWMVRQPAHRSGWMVTVPSPSRSKSDG